ncbi:MAG: hypothetical protein IJH39_11725 [Clostridia bacterium]|nr:hypothetical protein [Clostridia bacterium]
MNREVIKYKFNRNHIKIYTVHNPEKWTISQWGCPRYDINTSYHRSNYVNDVWYNTTRKNKNNYIEERCISKLGFYYTKRTYINNNSSNSKIDESSYRTINTISFRDSSGDIHIFSFYSRYGENSASRTEDGLRPWEICEKDNNMPDHMLTALWKDANDFFAEMEVYDKNVYFTTGYIGSSTKKDHDLYSVKKEVFEYLFGSIKGIRFQTDMEKIISHGFDPKYSFRKDKEKK